MIIQTSSAQIGAQNYSFYCNGSPVTPDTHTCICIPQPEVNGLKTFCSCGEWTAAASFYDYDTRDTMTDALDAAFQDHLLPQSLT